MPYFERTEEEEYIPSFDSENEWDGDEDSPEYDDGLDDPDGEDIPEEEPLSEEELRAAKQRRFRIAAGLGDLGGILVGVALILVLVILLISLFQFVASDFSQNFSIWQTRF